MAITEKQYKKALSIVEAYHKQLLDSAFAGCFFLDDLVKLSGNIQIPKLKEGIIDENFAAWLEEELHINNQSVRLVSLDDMGFISISFWDGVVTDERMLLVLKILNNREQSKSNKNEPKTGARNSGKRSRPSRSTLRARRNRGEH